MSFPDQVMWTTWEEEEGVEEEELGGLEEEEEEEDDGSQTGTTGEEEGRSMVSVSVPHWPVALGHGVRNLQEGGAHHVEGFVRQG